MQAAEVGKGQFGVRAHSPRESWAQKGGKTQTMTWPVLSYLPKIPAGHLDLCNTSSESVGWLIIFPSKLMLLILSLHRGYVNFNGTIFLGSSESSEMYLVVFEALVNGSPQLCAGMSQWAVLLSNSLASPLEARWSDGILFLLMIFTDISNLIVSLVYIAQGNHKYLSQGFGLKRNAKLRLKVTDGLIVMNGNVVIFIFQKHPLQ